MSAYKLSNDFEISLQEAQDFIDSFYASYPGLKQYFDRCIKEALKEGFIRIDKFTGRISHNDSLQRKYEEALSVIRVYNEKNLKPPSATLSDYYVAKSQIGRNSQNYPIQGTAAGMTKIAFVLLYDIIKDRNLWNDVKIVGQVHDEIILEVRNEIAEEMSTVLSECMEKAGKVFLRKVPVASSGKISKVWEH